MNKGRFRQLTGWILIFSAILAAVSPQCQLVYALPEHLTIFSNEIAALEMQYPFEMTLAAQSNPAIRLHSFNSVTAVKSVAIEPDRSGQSLMQISLLGLVPVKKVVVDVVPARTVYQGGESIGIVLKGEGVLVAGISPIIADDNKTFDLAGEAGIKSGDRIIAVNGENVNSEMQLVEQIDKAGQLQQAVELELKRDNDSYSVSVKPEFCADTRRYRIGLFVRDSTAGIGTLTFVAPESHEFGALGHQIIDDITGEPAACMTGKIVRAEVENVESGHNGRPGEKVSKYFQDDDVVGTINKNSVLGIYGGITNARLLKLERVEAASMNSIEPGYAEIMTVIDGGKIERFAIEIDKINRQERPRGKGIVFHVIDERLLSRTGGIVQGMSGSPIIQHGKLVGAVTHVFIHEPSRGYGCFLDWMLMEGGVLPKPEENTISQLFG